MTLDTTRYDAIGPDARNVTTPSFNALVARGARFVNAYAAVPETLPSHSTILTGLYPPAHGVHENARDVATGTETVAEKLKAAGYSTAAFVSAYPLARRFGLARGFDSYDDDFGAAAERRAADTTSRAIEKLSSSGSEPAFVWVHFFDPHYPYEPIEPFKSRYSSDPYRAEVAAMDAELGRLVAAFEQKYGADAAVIVLADHGEGLGDHGEALHGNLLYQSTVHVPLVVKAPGFAGVRSDAVSTRRVFHTILDLAGVSSEHSLRAPEAEVVMGEAMKPYLDFGWQPQVMAIEKNLKTIRAGRLEAYDVSSDRMEQKDLGADASLSREVRRSLQEYPIPSLTPAPAAAPLTEEEKKRLASLGYVSSATTPVIRSDAPRPADMAALFPLLDRASGLFAAGEYRAAIPLLESIVARDPNNLTTVLRLAVAHSALNDAGEAERFFMRARSLAPQSADVDAYYGLHLARRGDFVRAEPLLEKAAAEHRLPALEALADLRERQNRAADALALWKEIEESRWLREAELARVGALAMSVGDTDAAIQAFEKLRTADPAQFRNDLELGVLYLASRRYEDARAALDRVKPSHPDYPMALFKRAQVSVLLGEADRQQRIEAARRGADATTRELIARERLFAQ